MQGVWAGVSSVQLLRLAVPGRLSNESWSRRRWSNGGLCAKPELQEQCVCDDRAVVLSRPICPASTVLGVRFFAADFLLDTTRTAYLPVRNGIRGKCTNIRFILSHAEGFVPAPATAWRWPSWVTPEQVAPMLITTASLAEPAGDHRSHL